MRNTMWTCLAFVVVCSSASCRSSEPKPPEMPPTLASQPAAKKAAAASHSETPKPAVFANWPSATEQAIEVSMALWTLCRDSLPSEEEATHGPHNNRAIVVRINPEAKAAFMARTPMPLGTTIIKEKHEIPRDTPMFSTKTARPPLEFAWMTRREQGWEYGYADVDGKRWEGDLKQCSSCHNKMKDHDYLFRTYLQN